MPYKQFNNPLSRKTSPLLKTSPFRNEEEATISDAERTGISDAEHHALSSYNDEHSIILDGSDYDSEFDKAMDTKEKLAEYYRSGQDLKDENDIVKNVTSTILETSKLTPVGTEADGLDQLQMPVRKKDLVDLDSKLGKKALASIDAANNENLSVDDRNIAERRARRQLARQQRKEIRKNMPKGKERREAIKKTRENQGRKEENMVSE
tara:strand:+ start:1614 stop:2237 length:624 start_codon:yes stop_codon:yes gene_type:complete